MGKMKDLLICNIEMLACLSGYDPEELMDIYFAVQDECAEAGEPFDAEAFAAVTLERDW